MKSIIEEFTAQHNWKAHYKKAMEYRALGILEQEYVYLSAARDFRREAALERINARLQRELAAAQATITEKRIEHHSNAVECGDTPYEWGYDGDG